MRGGFVVVLLSASLVTSFAFAGWEHTEWGMSPDQVMALVPNSVPPDFSEEVPSSFAPHFVGRIRTLAVFYYDGGVLSKVELDVIDEGEDCLAAEKMLIDAYGAPKVDDETSDIYDVRFKWQDPARQNIVAFRRMTGVGSPSLCRVTYTPMEKTSFSRGF